MSLDKNKLSAEATRFLQKGQLDRAIHSYERILQADPTDTRALLKIAEIQQKKGEMAEAAATFTRVAEAYSEQGFFLKSVAVYKQVLKLAPDDVRVLERLAQLYQQLGLVSEAMAQLQAIVRAAESSGDDEKLLEALRRVVEIDPDHVPSSVKLGELYARLSQPSLAVEHLRRAAEQLKRNSRLDEYAKVVERVAALVPDDHALAREVASLILERGDARRALHHLQECYRVDPRQLETLTLLTRVFRELGQDTKTAAALREIARLHEDEGRRADATEAWRQVAELEPDDPEAMDALAAVTAATPPPVPSDTAAPVGRNAGRPLGQATRDPSPEAPSGAGTPDTDATIAKLLGETDVYVKYGLHEKALEHLQKVFAIDPDHVDGREKASRIREARRDLTGAAEDELRAVHGAQARGLADRARAGLDRLRALSPQHPEIAQLTTLLAVEGAAPVDAEEGVVVELEELTGEVIELDAQEDAPPPPATAPGAAVASHVVPEGEPGDVALPPATSGGAAVVAQAEPPPPVADAEAILAAERGMVDAGEILAVELDGLDEHGGPPPRGALEEDLAEADFFIARGLLEEARELLADLARRSPHDPAVATRIADLERATPRVHAQRALVTPAPVPDYLYSVRDVLEPFKKGIEQTITHGDSQTHYDLAIAFKEMGLLADAVHELEVALEGSDGTRRIDCLSLIGTCRLESGDQAGAIQAYRAALGSPGLTEELRHAVEYQLATAYEAAGEPAVALHFLNGILAAVPDYRDVPARVARLGGGSGHPPADAANPADPVAGTTASAGRSH